MGVLARFELRRGCSALHERTLESPWISAALPIGKVPSRAFYAFLSVLASFGPLSFKLLHGRYSHLSPIFYY
jgi:hypothetical protein